MGFPGGARAWGHVRVRETVQGGRGGAGKKKKKKKHAGLEKVGGQMIRRGEEKKASQVDAGRSSGFKKTDAAPKRGKGGWGSGRGGSSG